MSAYCGAFLGSEKFSLHSFQLKKCGKNEVMLIAAPNKKSEKQN